MTNIKKIYSTLGWGIALIIILSIIFFFTGLTKYPFGDIGDYVGGLTSPISSIIGSLFIYYALVEQTKQFTYINKRDTLFRIYETFEKRTENFNYELNEKQYTGKYSKINNVN